MTTSAERLADQLRALARSHPGREVDLIAHSQGGLVTRVFLQTFYDPADPTFPPLGTVVTLSSPLSGVPLATAGRRLLDSPLGRFLDRKAVELAGAAPSEVDAVRDLASDSALRARLERVPVPEHFEITSIGAAGDWIVPATEIGMPGAQRHVVNPKGLGDHTSIKTDRDAMRATRLALERRPLPCPTLGQAWEGLYRPLLISGIERVGAAVADHLDTLTSPARLVNPAGLMDLTALVREVTGAPSSGAISGPGRSSGL